MDRGLGIRSWATSICTIIMYTLMYTLMRLTSAHAGQSRVLAMSRAEMQGLHPTYEYVIARDFLPIHFHGTDVMAPANTSTTCKQSKV